MNLSLFLIKENLNNDISICCVNELFGLIFVVYVIVNVV